MLIVFMICYLKWLEYDGRLFGLVQLNQSTGRRDYDNPVEACVTLWIHRGIKSESSYYRQYGDDVTDSSTQQTKLDTYVRRY